MKLINLQYNDLIVDYFRVKKTYELVVKKYY